MRNFSNTRQGVRDLNVIKSKKPAGRILAEVPEEDNCAHRRMIPIEMNLQNECLDCGRTFDVERA